MSILETPFLALYFADALLSFVYKIFVLLYFLTPFLSVVKLRLWRDNAV